MIDTARSRGARWPSPRGASRAGFSIVELVVVVAVIAILVSIGVAMIPRHELALNQAAAGLAQNVQLARFEAIRQNTFVGLRVPAGSDGYEFFTGRTYPGAGVFRTVRFGDDSTPWVSIGTVVPEADLVFDPRGVLVTQLGADGQDVTLVARGSERTVTITQHGRTSVR